MTSETQQNKNRQTISSKSAWNQITPKTREKHVTLTVKKAKQKRSASTALGLS